MTIFLRLLTEADKAVALAEGCARVRQGADAIRCFDVDPSTFDAFPMRPFAYWVSESVRNSFTTHPSFGSAHFTVLGGLKTLSDERFLRCWWEIVISLGWVPVAKGGAYSPFYSDIPLTVDWRHNGDDISWYGYQRRPREGFGAASRGVDAYLRPGVTWGRRTQSFGPRVLPRGCIFSDKGPAAFHHRDDSDVLLARCGLMLSLAFLSLVSTRLNAADATARSFEVGLIKDTPVPLLSNETQNRLGSLVRRAWSLKRTLDTTTEISHAFLLPAAVRSRLGDYDPTTIETALARIQGEIDAIAFDLYGFSESDREAAMGSSATANNDADAEDVDGEEDAEEADKVAIPSADALLSWAIGVAFGRFDWRLATGERTAPPKPEPFDPLPAKSPGMLPDGDPPFHTHGGILVDDPGHPHDLLRIAEHVLERVDMPVPGDLRRWLQGDFFPFHLQRYSKSRRKAPIYWPLATESGSYTLWLYYPSLTSQTLYTAVNDFVEPKLKQMTDEASLLRAQGSGRSHADEKRLEALESLETELRDLRDQLLAIAPRYQPNHDDGVQITAAPLWPLFRHKPWQKVLKDTWAKLGKGEYDWAHLAMAYWPDRVREKCKTDKSLAIAHGLEELYVEPEPRTEKTRGRGAKGAG